MEPEKVVLDVDEDVDDEEEKEHFFADLVPSDRDDDDEDDDVVGGEPLHPSSTAPAGVAAGGAGSVVPGGAAAAVSEQDRRAQIGASPYLAPFTPLSSPSRPKTPSSVNITQQQQQSQQQQRSASKKPQLVPMKNGPPFGGGGGSDSRVPKDDVVQHLPVELVESLMATVQTLDKLILGVEDYKPDQLGFLHEKVNSYVELLRQIDSAGANYHASIPLQVLECVSGGRLMVLVVLRWHRASTERLKDSCCCLMCDRMIDGQENTNPELYTKAQLEKCQDESERAAGKVDTLRMLKEALESGSTDL